MRSTISATVKPCLVFQLFREKLSLAILLGHVMRSLLSCLYARHNILFSTSAKNDPSLFLFLYDDYSERHFARLVDDIHIPRVITENEVPLVGLEYRSRSSWASLLKSLSVPNEQHLPTSLFINAKIKRGAGQKKSANPDSSLIVSETLTMLERRVALMVAPRVSCTRVILGS